MIFTALLALIGCGPDPVNYEASLAKKEYESRQRSAVESVDRDDSAARGAFVQFVERTDDHAGGYLEWNGAKSTVLWTVYQSAYAEFTSGEYKHYGPKWTIYAKSANGRYFFVTMDIEYNRFSPVVEMTPKQIYERAKRYGKSGLIPQPPMNDA